MKKSNIGLNRKARVDTIYVEGMSSLANKLTLKYHAIAGTVVNIEGSVENGFVPFISIKTISASTETWTLHTGSKYDSNKNVFYSVDYFTM